MLTTPGVGKSIALAAVTNQLETELVEDEGWALQYLSCETLQNSTGSDARNDSSVSSTRVQNTLVYNLYDLANRAYEGDAPILEKCNTVFTNPKEKKSSSILMKGQKVEDLLPDLDEAFESLALALNKKIFLVIDAVELISEAEEEAFANALQSLLNVSSIHVRILVSCFSGCKFYSALEKKETPQLTLSEYNQKDIRDTIKGKLRTMPGWSDAEREEAHSKIVEKSGSHFKYAMQVAIPFLEEPWQRPLSNRLKQLPGGVEETYSQTIRQMAPNYRALLQTSVTWALLASGPVTVTEVMDAHLGTYLTDNSLPSSPGKTEESALYRDQIREAGGPFLDCQKTEDQSVVKLKDPSAVRRFFLRETVDLKSEEKEEVHVCDNCRNQIDASQDLKVSEKEGHLALAITLGMFITF